MAQTLSDFHEKLDAVWAENGERAHQLFDALSPDQLAWRPGPKRWSVGEVLGHLVQTGDKYAAQAQKSIGKARAAGKIVQTDEAPKHSLVGGMILNRVQPGFKGRTPAPSAFAPPAALPDDIVPAYFNSRETIKSLLNDAKGLPLDTIKVGSPVLPLVRINLADVLRILVQHERRHLGQTERVMHTDGFPQAPASGAAS